MHDRAEFAHPVVFWTAVAGMAALNLLNLRLLLDLVIVQPTASRLAEDDYLNSSQAPALAPVPGAAVEVCTGGKRKAD